MTYQFPEIPGDRPMPKGFTSASGAWVECRPCSGSSTPQSVPARGTVCCTVRTQGLAFLRWEHWQIWKRPRLRGHFAGLKLGPVKLMIGWNAQALSSRVSAAEGR